MNARQGDRRYQASIWRRLLGWILPERRDGWEQRARPVILEPTSGGGCHNQVLPYGAAVDHRRDCGEIERAPAVPAIPGTLRPGSDEAALVERERQEQEGGGDAKHVS